MDFVVLGIGLIFLICVIVGIYKGAIKIAVSLVTTLLTLVIVFFATPFVADLIESKTPVAVSYTHLDVYKRQAAER